MKPGPGGGRRTWEEKNVQNVGKRDNLPPSMTHTPWGREPHEASTHTSEEEAAEILAGKEKVGMVSQEEDGD